MIGNILSVGYAALTVVMLLSLKTPDELPNPATYLLWTFVTGIFAGLGFNAMWRRL